MRALNLLLPALLLAPALAAQGNPFEMPKSKINAMQIAFSYGGDLPGTGTEAMSGTRFTSHMTTSGKMFGKTTNTDSWTLTTPDSIFHADLVKKTGTQVANPLPAMTKAYKELDGDSKERLRRNMQEMASLMAQAFGNSLMSGGEKTGSQTYAGQACDERTFGTWHVCTMSQTPQVALHVQGSMLCFNYEQTATSVTMGEPPASAFEAPAGITFVHDTSMRNVDSTARGFIGYLASQALSDSLAAAKAKMAEEHPASATPQGQEAQPQMTPAEQQQACEALKNFSLGQVMSNAGKKLLASAGDAAKQAAEDEAKRKAASGLNGLKKKLHFP